MSDYIKQQHEARNRAWEEAKALLDNAAKDKRDLTAEENEKYDRINADLENRAKVIETIKADQEREFRALEAMKGVEAQARPEEIASASQNDAEAIRSLARGEIRSYDFERRDVTKTSTGSPVPTSFYNQVLLLARQSGPMLETSTILNTAGGESLQIPSIGTYSSGTVASEGAAIGESDPVFNSFVTLGAFKYSFLTQVSRELIEDAGVDILGFLADQIGNTMGTTANSRLTLGTGTIMPNGIVTRAGSGVASTATSLAADDLISLVYSLDTVARRLPGSGFMMNANTVAAVRKLKDSSGQYLFSPSMNSEDRDLLLGHRIYENPAMSNVGSAVKSVIFGNLSSYFVRQVGGIRIDRSDDYAFNQDLITFRAQVRLDGNLVQTSHVKYLTTS